MPKLASFRVKLINIPSEKGRFGFLLRSLRFGSNRLLMEITIVIALTGLPKNVAHIYYNLHILTDGNRLTSQPNSALI